ncbi:sulfatase family protein [Carboxylicivirga sp. RSCT41]|uniref:sulfatase family protein n=1 Tax=Carboxylicivirga agarovorans TaxID=3417570 RepID=UPI003D35189E
MKVLLSALAVTLSLFACTASKKETPEKPNIIIILADDMGYGDVQALNTKSEIATPNLNKLASESVVFTDAHTPSSVCTPTRYGLLTGRYCWRTRLKKGVLRGYDKPLIKEDRPTIASYLKEEGYATGIIGKWHLGLGFQKDEAKSKSKKPVYDITRPLYASPNNNGFDYSYVLPASLDFAPYVYVKNNKVTATEYTHVPHTNFPQLRRKGLTDKKFEFEGVLDHFLSEAKNYIRRQAKSEQPFFLYFPFTAPHTPLLPTENFKGKSGKGVYGDFIMQVDWTAGEILKLLDELEIADNTLVIFTSDNGSPMARIDNKHDADHCQYDSLQYYNADKHQANHLYSGIKGDVLEGGHRVPFFVRWSGRFKPSVVNDAPICLTDVVSTVAELIGSDLPAGAAEDSYSFYPVLTAKQKNVNRPAIVHHSGKGMFAVRKGDWKLILGNGSGARTEPIGEPFAGPFQLYNLKEDIQEQTNLIDSEQTIKTDIEVAFEKIKTEK